MPKRFIAVIIELPDDDALAEVQRHMSEPSVPTTWLTATVQAWLSRNDLPGWVRPRVYDVMPHPYSPYIHDMTVRGLRL